MIDSPPSMRDVSEDVIGHGAPALPVGWIYAAAPGRVEVHQPPLVLAFANYALAEPDTALAEHAGRAYTQLCQDVRQGRVRLKGGGRTVLETSVVEYVRDYTVRSVASAAGNALAWTVVIAIGSTIVFALAGGFQRIATPSDPQRAVVEEKCRSIARNPGGDFSSEDTYGACMLIEGYTP